MLFTQNNPPYLSVSLLNDIDVIHYAESAGQWIQDISLQDWAWVGVLIHFTLTLFIIVRIISTQRNTGVAIAWIVLLFVIPVASIIAYLLVGEPYLGRSYKARNIQAQHLLSKMNNPDESQANKISEMLPERYQGVSRIGILDTGFKVYNNHTMQLLTSAECTFDYLIQDINNAQSLILMEFYIIFPKGRVQDVFTALLHAANRGVECQILADSVGSFSFFTDDWFEVLTEAGVVIHQSLPVGLFKTLFKRSDLRNHRKIVVIDEYIGYTGSFNLVDSQFFKQDQGVGQWIDLVMRIKTDQPFSVVSALTAVCVTDISAESSSNLIVLGQRIDERINNYTRKLLSRSKPTINDLNDRAPVALKQKISNVYISDEYGRKLRQHESLESSEHSNKLMGEVSQDAFKSALKTSIKSTQSIDYSITNPDNHIRCASATHTFEIDNLPKVNDVIAQLIPSAPRLTGHVIYNTLLTVLHRANWRIQITTPYFVPDEALLSALTTAAKRGVEVTLIIPKKVDSFLVQHASQASYSILMESGVKIGLFTGGLLHAKTVVIDEDYCLFGTVNMDMRSFYLNMEISLAIYTPEVVAQVLACHDAYIAECEWIDAEEWSKRSGYLKLFDNSIRLFSPLL